MNPTLRKHTDLIKIVSVGRFVRQKDYETALRAISILKDNFVSFEYHIIGWGELECEIRRKISEFGIEKQVRVHINPPNVQELIHDSNIFLLTSLFEGTSNAIMEALDHSLPVIATNVGDNEQLVVDNSNGYICATGDATDIAEKLMKLCKDSELRNQMGVKGNKLLKEKYSQVAFSTKYIELIQD